VTAGPNDLCTVADVQAYLGLPSGQDAALIQTLVTAASVLIQSYLGYNIASATYTETRSGHGRESLALRNGPVTAIQSLTVGATTQSASPGYDQTGYSFDGGRVYLSNGVFSCGIRNISITYTAGYATVPDDLAQACIELVSLRYKLKDKTGFISEGGLGQTTSYSQRDMPASVMTALQPYRRVF
jgi:uncharacterized phiE125 gp8 family phage protein